MNDIYAIRLANLNKLLKEPDLAALRQREQAIQLNMGSSMLSQLTAGKKMGDDVARKIEAARNLPENWMDNAHEQGSQLARPDPVMLAESIEALRRAWRDLNLGSFDPVTEVGMLVWAYESRSAMGDEPSSAQQFDFGVKLATKLAETNRAMTGAGDGRGKDKLSGGADKARAKAKRGDPS